MPHSLVLVRVHIVFSTKNREPLINLELQPKLWAYFRGIARNQKMDALAVGGMEDHVHLLVGLPSTISVAKAVQLLKGNTSKWLNEKGMNFDWQQGYAAFSVSNSLVSKVCQYIRNQRQHHKRFSYEEEIMALLKKHGIDADLADVLG